MKNRGTLELGGNAATSEAWWLQVQSEQNTVAPLSQPVISAEELANFKEELKLNRRHDPAGVEFEKLVKSTLGMVVKEVDSILNPPMVKPVVVPHLRINAVSPVAEILRTTTAIRQQSAKMAKVKDVVPGQISKAERLAYSAADRLQYGAATVTGATKPVMEKAGETVVSASKVAVQVGKASIRVAEASYGMGLLAASAAKEKAAAVTPQQYQKAGGLVMATAIGLGVVHGNSLPDNARQSATESLSVVSPHEQYTQINSLPVAQISKIAGPEAAKIISPARRAATTKPGSEVLPIPVGLRSQVAKEASNFAQSLMLTAQKVAVSRHEISKTEDSHARSTVSHVDQFLLKNTIPHIADGNLERASAIAAAVADTKFTFRYPATAAQFAPAEPALTPFQQTVLPAVTSTLFGENNPSYNADQQRVAATAVARVIEVTAAPSDLQAIAASLQENPASTVLTTPLVPESTSSPSASSSPEVATQVGNLDIEHYHGIAWTSEDLAKVQANLPVYQTAAAAYDLPWELLAVIHKREHGLALSNPSNGQGIYQFYAEAGAYPPGDVSQVEFLRQTKLLAERIRKDYSQRGMRDIALNAESIDAQKVMDTLGRYNGLPRLYRQQAADAGFSGKDFMGSPYVVNLMGDAENSDKNPNWKQYLSDGTNVGPANHQPGAYLAFKELLNVSGDSSRLVDEVQLPTLEVPHVSQAVHEASLNIPDKLADGTRYYSQHNGPWAHKTYDKPGRNRDISEGGCGPTTEAMVVSNLAGSDVTPDAMAQWNVENGYRTDNDGTSLDSFKAFAQAYGLHSEDVSGNPDKILATLQGGGMVIINAQDRNPNTPGTPGGHILALRGISADGKILILDPNSFEFTNQEWNLADLLSESTAQFAVTK